MGVEGGEGGLAWAANFKHRKGAKLIQQELGTRKLLMESGSAKNSFPRSGETESKASSCRVPTTSSSTSCLVWRHKVASVCSTMSSSCNTISLDPLSYYRTIITHHVQNQRTVKKRRVLLLRSLQRWLLSPKSEILYADKCVHLDLPYSCR